MDTRKLRHYFGGYFIIVLTSHSLKNVLQKSDVLGRLAHIAIELSEFNIHFKQCPTIKGKVVANFITYWMEEGTIQVVETREEIMEEKCWKVYMDRANNSKGA